MEQLISVIIPTYNRPDRLTRLLACLAKQTYPVIGFEVIAVDDGSPVEYPADVLSPHSEVWPFPFRLIRQENQGEAIARNTGVQASQGELMVFLDDDMIIEPGYLGGMQRAYLAHPGGIFIGNMDLYQDENPSIFQRITASSHTPTTFGEVHFTAILAGVLALARSIYLELGGMRPRPGEKRGGWIDMDFAYRAHLKGRLFYRVQDAVAHHDDYTNQNLSAACKRAYNVSRLSVPLFQTHPALLNEIPMFADKLPIEPGKDPLPLIVRKVLRKHTSKPWSVKTMERIIQQLEARYPEPAVLSRLYRWVIGAYIYRGFQAGFQESADRGNPNAQFA